MNTLELRVGGCDRHQIVLLHLRHRCATVGCDWRGGAPPEESRLVAAFGGSAAVGPAWRGSAEGVQRSSESLAPFFLTCSCSIAVLSPPPPPSDLAPTATSLAVSST
eukprot:scaffold1179_cov118-Isochrysis_galbana.AAC.9